MSIRLAKVFSIAYKIWLITEMFWNFVERVSSNLDVI